MAAIPNNEGPTKNTRRIYDHAGWVPNKSVVRMWLHRGGGYINNPDIHEGGAWVEKEGVLFVPAGQSGQFDTAWFVGFDGDFQMTNPTPDYRSEEHTSELQSLMRISYAVFCLKKKMNNQHIHVTI